MKNILHRIQEPSDFGSLPGEQCSLKCAVPGYTANRSVIRSDKVEDGALLTVSTVLGVSQSFVQSGNTSLPLY